LAFFNHALQFGRGAGVFGVDGDDLPQAVFALGVTGSEGRQPHPGIFVARLGNQHEMEHLARFVWLPALRREDGLAEEFFSAHERVCPSTRSEQRLTA
jgi:hypothetical protein